MLKVKSMAFDELLVAKGKIETEIELRSARERSRLIEAIGELRSVAAAKSATALMLGPMLSKVRNFPRATAIPRTARKPGQDGAIGQGGSSRRLKAARSWRRSRSDRYRQLLLSGVRNLRALAHSYWRGFSWPRLGHPRWKPAAAREP